MLILATVTIGAINGGLFDYAGKAKKETEVASEKSQIEIAYVIAKDLSKTGRVTEQNLQKQLDKQLGENISKTYQMEDVFEIFIVDTNRYYELDNKGNLVAKELIKDSRPANFYYDKDGNTLDGSTDKPYEINCIEDLVILANFPKGMGNYIDENGNIEDITSINKFSGKDFVLTRTLNFNSPASYSDLSIKWSYDVERDIYIIDENSSTNLQEIITDKNGVGFTPIGTYSGGGATTFSGNFDGQNFEIQNIYEHRIGKVCGLFEALAGSSIIKNLGIEGTYINNQRATGFCPWAGNMFYNCHNKVTIKSSSSALGLANYGTFINCYNEAEIKRRWICSRYKLWRNCY